MTTRLVSTRRCAACAVAVAAAVAGWQWSMYPPTASAAQAVQPEDDLCSVAATRDDAEHAAHSAQLASQARQHLQASLVICLSCAQADAALPAVRPLPHRPLLAHDQPLEFLARRAAPLPRPGSTALRLPGRA